MNKKMKNIKYYINLATTLILLLFIGGQNISAQRPSRLTGTITDETGARVSAAIVSLTDAEGQKITVKSDEQGRYVFSSIKPGAYLLSIESPGFKTYTSNVDLTTRPTTNINATLKVIIAESMDIKADFGAVSTDPDNNLSAVNLTKKDMDALPNDRNELLQTLNEIAGVPNGGGTVYVDGFTNTGRIPPKSTIQSIRINANPFSSEYSEPGRGRIEIISKPGSDGYHGEFGFDFNDGRFNARNAFAIRKAPLQIKNFDGEISGPFIPNKWGFLVSFERQDQRENANVNATILDPVTYSPLPFYAVVETPSLGIELDMRTTYLFSGKHTFGIRYQRTTDDAKNQGLQGGYDLVERAYNSNSSEDMMRITLTSILNDKSVNQFRLGLERNRSDTNAVSNAPAIIVQNTFSSGGNQGSLYSENNRRRLEINDILTYTRKKHTFKTGIRANALRPTSLNKSNFGGTFTFGGGEIVDSQGNSASISALEMYRGWLLNIPGYHPQEYSVAVGDPFIGFTQWEMSGFLQDDWKLSERVTVSTGLRLEFQTHLSDHNNIAPRIGLAWNPDKKRKSVIRFGAGIFYSRFDSGITGDTIRYDGLHQRQYIINEPNFFTPPTSFSPSDLIDQAIRVKSPNINLPYSLLSTLSYERQLPGKIQMSSGITWQRGIHLLRTRNINAPLPGVANLLPVPGHGPILEFESTGLSNRKEFSLMLRGNPNAKLSLITNYILSSSHSDTDGPYSTPADPYNLSTEWGRSSSDIRHQFTLTGSLSLPLGWRISPSLNVMSGRPFNITTGRDDNMDSAFSDRPAFAKQGDPNALVTRFGIFNPFPEPGDKMINRNFGNGPGQIRMNIRLQKTLGFGKGESDDEGPGKPGEAKKVSYRYNARIVLEAYNVLNHTNLQGYNGVLSSESFGLANRALNPRRINISLKLEF